MSRDDCHAVSLRGDRDARLRAGVRPAIYSCDIDTSSATSPPVDSLRTTPTPFAYHLYSWPASSSDQSFVFTQSLYVPAGTVTVSPTATTLPNDHRRPAARRA